MKRLLWNDLKTIDYLEQQLDNGEVVLAQGDTVLGLLANVSKVGAAHLNQVKVREKKPFLLLVHDYKKALDLIDLGDKKSIQIEKLMNNCWPGPVTLIFYAKQGLEPYIKHSNGTIAVRVPDHAGLLRLLERFDALFSTSANVSGEPVPHAIDQVDPAILHAVSCIVVNDEHEGSLSAVPSTIIDCTGDTLVVVRQGAFELTRLLN